MCARADDDGADLPVPGELLGHVVHDGRVRRVRDDQPDAHPLLAAAGPVPLAGDVLHVQAAARIALPDDGDHERALRGGLRVLRLHAAAPLDRALPYGPPVPARVERRVRARQRLHGLDVQARVPLVIVHAEPGQLDVQHVHQYVLMRTLSMRARTVDSLTTALVLLTHSYYITRVFAHYLYSTSLHCLLCIGIIFYALLYAFAFACVRTCHLCSEPSISGRLPDSGPLHVHHEWPEEREVLHEDSRRLHGAPACARRLPTRQLGERPRRLPAGLETHASRRRALHVPRQLRPPAQRIWCDSALALTNSSTLCSRFKHFSLCYKVLMNTYIT